MATSNREGSAQNRIAQYFLLDALDEGRNLLHRFQEGEAFRRHVRKRVLLVTPLALLVAASSIACAAAMVVFFSGAGPLLTLAAIVLAPFVLIASLFVQCYVLFSWLEGRALARSYGRREVPRGMISAWIARKLRADMGRFPPVPWGLALFFVIAPLAMFVKVAPFAACTLIALLITAPIVYARFDR